MTARTLLFVSRATIPWCVGRYLGSDHPENVGTWRSLPPFANEDGTVTDAQRNKYQLFLSTRDRFLSALNTSSNANPFEASNWTVIDVTNWWRTETTNPQPGQPSTDEQRLHSMSRQSIDFISALTDSTPTIQWAHVCDAEMATSWLARAMRFTPAQIDAMSPEEQRVAIDDMFAAFGLFWKSLNVAPQGWARYRSAWEFFARLPYLPAVLKNDFGEFFPRPSVAPIWPPRRGEFFPSDAPKYLGPWRWEAMLAQASHGANQHGRMGHTAWDAATCLTYGGTPRVAQTDGTRSPSYSCQDTVIYGGLYISNESYPSPISCFAPMGESHMYWLDNAAMLGGGMETIWRDGSLSMTRDGVGLGQPATSLLIRCPSMAPDVSLSAASFYAVQPMTAAGALVTPQTRPWEVASGGISTSYGDPRGSGEQTWRDGRLISLPGTELGSETPLGGGGPVPVSAAGTFAPRWYFEDFFYSLRSPPRSWWQPPAKRYVDLLWPLLVYLNSKTIQEILYEVKIDVIGKNGYSLLARGGTAEGGTDALNDAAAEFQTSMQRARLEAEATQAEIRRESTRIPRLVLGISGAVASAVAGGVASIFGTPAAGVAVASAVSAGFAALNGVLNLAEGAPSHAWVNVGFDIFGRPDGAPGTGAYRGFSLGNCERYAIYNVRPGSSRGFNGSETDAVKSMIYTSMRLRERVGTSNSTETGWTSFRDGFIAPIGSPPYPAGQQVSLVILPGMPGLPSVLPPPSGAVATPRRVQNLDPSPPLIDPVTAAAAALVGAAVGAVASEVRRVR